MVRPIRGDVSSSLAYIPLLAVRLAADGGDAAGRRLALLILAILIVHGWAALAVSFGCVFGREVFGGKPILPPALIGLAFALFCFPTSGFELLGLLSRPPEPMVALACLAGAALLARFQGLSLRVAAGAIVGTLAVGYG